MIERLLPRLSSDAHALLASERALPVEDEALRQRLLERARAALETDRPSGVALRLADVPEASRLGRTRLRRTALLLAAALAVAGLAAAGAGVLRRKAAMAPGAPSSASPARAVVGRVTPEPPVAAPSEAAPDAASAGEPARVPASQAEGPHPANASSYALELELLEPARSSIAHGDFQSALTAILRHQRAYPHGQLSEEREALRVRALWGSGQTRAAELAAAVFRKRYPRSGLLSWMKGPVTPK